MRRALAPLLCGLLILGGCAARQPARVNRIVALACLTAPVVLVDCDGSEPPRCRTARVSYRRGCERLAIQKAIQK